jgi:DNA-binding response OmpR family regulator
VASAASGIVRSVSSPQTKALILLVDDSMTTLTMVSARLQRMGYDVVTATRGEEALALALDRRPQLIVLDIEMPGLGGIEVSQRLRNAPSFADVPIILLTAHAEPEYVQAGLDAGANAYIVKPFSPQELATRIDDLLGRR